MYCTEQQYTHTCTFHLEVLCHHASNVHTALSSLRVVPVLEVEGSYAVQPGLSQFRGVPVRVSKTVMKIDQLLRVILVDLHRVSHK